jgi:hypothetical protein
MTRFFTLFLLLTLGLASRAQFLEANVLSGEFGVSVGGGHYFGDINTDASFNRPKLAASLFFRKQFGKYIALRAQGTYALLGYSDTYSDNEVQKLRNLSFNTDIFELALMGDFNFFRYIPGERGYAFTPYVSLGAGVFTYDPYAYLADEKYFLRPLGTEGQGTSSYPDRVAYSTMAVCFPIGVGVKYALSAKHTLSFEILHRFTNTDYLDDVSTTYAGPDVFPPLANGDPSPAFLLQDRSYELTSSPIGIAGRQRGISSQKDQYLTVQLGLTINFMNYRCPTPKY